MIKTLTKVGNSHALLLDKALLEALGITPDTPLQLSISGDHLTVQPANVGLGAGKVNEHAAAIRKRYGKTLKRLAK